MAYIGRGLDKLSNVDVLNTFSFTDSVGPYNITKGSPAVAFIPSAVQNLLIEVDGVIQASASYTITGSTITFGVSMSSSSTMNSFIHFGMGVTMTPADSTVSKAKLSTSLGGFNNWESKSADFTAAIGKAYFCNTSSNDIDVTLPAGAVQNDTLRFMDANGTFDTNDLTILYGSYKIQGASANLDVSTERAAFKLIYYDATQGWLLTEK